VFVPRAVRERWNRRCDSNPTGRAQQSEHVVPIRIPAPPRFCDELFTSVHMDLGDRGHGTASSDRTYLRSVTTSQCRCYGDFPRRMSASTSRRRPASRRGRESSPADHGYRTHDRTRPFWRHTDAHTARRGHEPLFL